MSWDASENICAPLAIIRIVFRYNNLPLWTALSQTLAFLSTSLHHIRWNGLVRLHFLHRLPWESCIYLMLFLLNCSECPARNKCKRIQCPWLAFTKFTVFLCMNSKYLLVAPKRIQQTNKRNKKSTFQRCVLLKIAQNFLLVPLFESSYGLWCDFIIPTLNAHTHIWIFILFTDEIRAI